jgi:hypothetical protein
METFRKDPFPAIAALAIQHWKMSKNHTMVVSPCPRQRKNREIGGGHAENDGVRVVFMAASTRRRLRTKVGLTFLRMVCRLSCHSAAADCLEMEMVVVVSNCRNLAPSSCSILIFSSAVNTHFHSTQHQTIIHTLNNTSRHSYPCGQESYGFLL